MSDERGRHFISLGAGVQSSTMALMAAAGAITPMPEGAIFADTQNEPPSVYKWLDWLESVLPFPVYRVSKGNLMEANLVVRRSKKTGLLWNKSLVPTFMLWPNGKQGQLQRACTLDYKITVVRKELRRLTKKQHVVQWMGISSDEAHRQKDSKEPWITNWYPLVEQGISRAACLAWMKAHGFPEPPRSACVHCPYHSDDEWIRLRDTEPESFAAAVKWERDYQAALKPVERIEATPYLHADRVPLDQVVLVPGRGTKQFGNECEGMCGV